MASSVIAFLTKLGLISESLSVPRKTRGFGRVILSIVAVAFSYFFIHISFFGPPVQEVFKGTYILGVAVLTILVFKGRQKPVRAGAIWLDEMIAFLSVVVMGASFAMWAYWGLIDHTELWRDIDGSKYMLAATIGGMAGVALYWWEATFREIPESPIVSDWLFLVAAISSVVWWMTSNVELQMRVGGPVPVEVVFFSGLLAAVSFDIARRIVGPVIPLIGLIFLIYDFAPIAQISPGIFRHQGFELARVMEFLMLEYDGMTGLIIEVFATYVVIFVIVGAFLEKTGLGSLFIDMT